MQNKTTSKTVTLVLAAMFSAIAYLIVFYVRIPLFIPSVSFLKYEPKDAILALESLILGPIPAMISSFVVSFVEMITISETGIIGAVMNFLSTSAFILPIGIIYSRHRNLKAVVIGLFCSIFCETSVMLLWNYFISPIYMGITREAIAKLLLPGFFPFNAIKSSLNAAITFLLYKPIVTALRKAHLMPRREESTSGKKSVLPVILNIACALFLLTAVVILIIKIYGGE